MIAGVIYNSTLGSKERKAQIAKWLDRDFSWSQLSSWEWNPEDWYKKYILGEKTDATAEMLFGSKVGQAIASDPAFLPHLDRYDVFEHEMRCKLGKIKLVMFIDGWTPTIKKLGEYKTGKRPWDQKRADEHGQIDMYLLGLWLTEKIKPEDVDCFLHWLPTEQNGGFEISFVGADIHTFPTKRTMRQLIDFGVRINKAHKAMLEYAKNHD